MHNYFTLYKLASVRFTLNEHEDHTRALNAGINDLPKEWRRPRGPLVKHGYAPSRMTSNIRTWDCGRPSTELMTVISGVISWKRRR